jgi:hypothetical protein
MFATIEAVPHSLVLGHSVVLSLLGLVHAGLPQSAAAHAPAEAQHSTAQQLKVLTRTTPTRQLKRRSTGIHAVASRVK